MLADKNADGKKIVFASSTPMNYIIFKPIADAIKKEFDIDNDRPTVLYAPTRSATSGT